PTPSAARCGAAPGVSRLALLLLLAAAAAAEPQSPSAPEATPPSAAPSPASTASPRSEDEGLARGQARKATLERELARLRGQEKSLLGEVDRLELEVRLRGEELREIQAVLQRANAELDATTKQLRALERTIAETRPVLAARARALYKMGELSYLRLLPSVHPPSRMFRAY